MVHWESGMRRRAAGPEAGDDDDVWTTQQLRLGHYIGRRSRVNEVVFHWLNDHRSTPLYFNHHYSFFQSVETHSRKSVAEAVLRGFF